MTTVDLRAICTAAIVEDAETRLPHLDSPSGACYRLIAPSWQRTWPRIVLIFDQSAESRKVIYMTATTGPVRTGLLKVCKSHGLFFNDQRAMQIT